MTERDTVDLLVGLLEAREPFLHVRFGDGDVFFATGTGPRLTGDGEEWSEELQSRLRWAWRHLAEHHGRLLVGDVESYLVSDGCEAQWDELREEARWIRNRMTPELPPLELVHIEALRVGLGYALPLYKAVHHDRRPKVFVGPQRLAGAANLLRAHHVVVPLHVAHEHVEDAVEAVLGRGPCEVVLLAAGRGGKIVQAHLSYLAPEMTQIDVGSGLDLLFDDGVRRGTDLRVDRAAVMQAYWDAGLLP